MSQVVMVQVVFDEPTQYGIYRDALYYTPDEFNELKQSDIDAAKQSRIDSYIFNVENPPAPPKYSKEELEQQLAAALQEKIDVAKAYDDKIADLEDKIDVAEVVVNG